MKKVYRYSNLFSELILEEINIIKETDKSYFLDMYKTKVIRKTTLDSSRWFCATTKNIALKQFINRTNKRLEWYAYYTKNCNQALEVAKDLLLKIK